MARLSVVVTAGQTCRRRFPFAATVVSALMLCDSSYAQDDHANGSTLSTPEKPNPTAINADEPKPVLQWGMGDSRSFGVPAYEIPALQLLLNRFDHYFEDAATYPWPWTNLRRNLHRSWEIDNDKFSYNREIP